MPTQTLTLQVDPKTRKLDARQVYDALMGAIEPDLVTSAIPGLTAKYTGETPADKKARAKRYDAAFKEYNTLMKNLMKQMRTHSKQSKRKALASTEAKEREVEGTELLQLESLFLQ
jgi:hypothetical protein